MKVFFDCEFIEDGKTIDLISIGLVREDGATLYMESSECDLTRANDWVKENVLVHLKGPGFQFTRKEMAETIVTFVGDKPTFWAYYADYDWVALCQLYGRMLDLPKGWPMFCRDIQQMLTMTWIKKESLPPQVGSEHHALSDALWNKAVYEYINDLGFFQYTKR